LVLHTILLVLSIRILIWYGSYWLSWSLHFENFMISAINSLTFTESLCHTLPRICSLCRYHNPTLYSFVTYHRICKTSSTTGVTCGTRTAFHSGAREFIFGFKWDSCCSMFLSVFCIVFYRSLFVFGLFTFGHCIVCPSSTYGFWFTLWYLFLSFLIVTTTHWWWCDYTWNPCYVFCRVHVLLHFCFISSFTNWQWIIIYYSSVRHSRLLISSAFHKGNVTFGSLS
jgi:hypothetical protein